MIGLEVENRKRALAIGEVEKQVKEAQEQRRRKGSFMSLLGLCLWAVELGTP